MERLQDLTHVHIGAGKLGLGLVIPITKNCGFRVFVLNLGKNKVKKEKLSSRKFILKTTKNETLIEFDNFFPYDHEINGPVLEAVSESSVRLLTTAVTEKNLEDVARSISLIIKKRRENGTNEKLYVIACENIKGNSTILKKHVIKYLQKEDIVYLESHVFFCDCVVDRVCWNLDEEKNDLIKVSTHSFNKWIINTDNLDPEGIEFLNKHLAKNESVKLLSSEDFKLEEDLKLWCFNGMHLILADYAKKYAWDRFRQHDYYLAKAIKTDSISDAMNRLQRVLTAGIQQVHNVSEAKIDQYHREFSERIRSEPDDTANRIIHDLLDSIEHKNIKELSAFLKKTHERINQPFQLAIDNKDNPVPNDLWKECTVMYSVLISVILNEMGDA